MTGKIKLPNGRITISIREDYVNIELVDDSSSITFAEVSMSHSDFVNALGRLGRVPCKVEIGDLDNLGKVMRHKQFEFKLPKGKGYDKKAAQEIAKVKCLAGWEPDLYFESQGSFFTKGNESWARCRIRRWE